MLRTLRKNRDPWPFLSTFIHSKGYNYVVKTQNNTLRVKTLNLTQTDCTKKYDKFGRKGNIIMKEAEDPRKPGSLI